MEADLAGIPLDAAASRRSGLQVTLTWPYTDILTSSTGSHAQHAEVSQRIKCRRGVAAHAQCFRT